MQLGITRKALGITGLGLRAGCAMKLIQAVGITPTLRGGDVQHEELNSRKLSTCKLPNHGALPYFGDGCLCRHHQSLPGGAQEKGC